MGGGGLHHQGSTPPRRAPPLLTESQMPVKTLPCPKLRLRAVITFVESYQIIAYCNCT